MRTPSGRGGVRSATSDSTTTAIMALRLRFRGNDTVVEPVVLEIQLSTVHIRQAGERETSLTLSLIVDHDFLTA